MADLNDIRDEILTFIPETPQSHVREKYLKKLYRKTKRPVILYASSFSLDSIPGSTARINQQDLSCFKAASAGLDGTELDLIIHSPGGSLPITEHLARYLRRRFQNLRVIIPRYALSTASLLCFAADKLILSDQGVLGPVDPLVSWSVQEQSFTSTAREVLNEVGMAQRYIKGEKNEADLWNERLRAYPPGLLAKCRDEIVLSRKLIQEFLESYLLSGKEDRAAAAKAVASWIGNATNFSSSRRPLDIDALRAKGLPVDSLEDGEDFYDDVMSVFHAALATFDTSDCVKIVQNHAGKGCSMSSRHTGISS
jgi:hypothetical protein